MSTTHPDCIIVGAGLFGAVVSQRLRERGFACLVLEHRAHIGGNCFTYDSDGIIVHSYGAHIFNTNSKRVWNYVGRFAQFMPFKNAPVALNNGRLYSLPINMFTFNQLWGVVSPAAARDRVRTQRELTSGRIDTVESVALEKVGRDVYETLIRDYTEKQWGRPCSELPGSVLSRIPIRYTYDNNYYNTRYQGIPVGGYTPLIARLLLGVEVRTGIPYEGVRGVVRDYLQLGVPVIWTGTIDSYFDYKLGHLEYRGLRFEHMVLDCDDYQGNAVVNYCDRTPYTRSIEHKHFMLGSGQECRSGRRTVVTREYPCSCCGTVDPYYPINDERNNALYARYAGLSRDPGLYFCGRLGSYRYATMSETVETALAFSDNLCNILKKGGRHDSRGS